MVLLHLARPLTTRTDGNDGVKASRGERLVIDSKAFEFGEG